MITENVEDLQNFFKDQSTTEKIEFENPIIPEKTESVNDELPPKGEYSNYIEGLVELGLLSLPEDYKIEDLDEEKLQELIEYNQDLKEQEALLRIRAKISDPRAWEIFETAEKGGGYANLDKLFQLQKQEEDLETDDKKAYLKKVYMQKGLSEKVANSTIDNLELDEELDDEYNRFEAERKTNATKQKQLETKQAEDAAKIERENQKKWSQSFNKELQEAKFSKKKQTEILGAFDEIQLEGGNTMSEWQYKFAHIKQNPSYFVQFLDLLSSFTPEKGFELGEKEDRETETKIAKTLLEKIQKHSNNPKLSGKTAKEDKPFTPVDPHKDSIKTLRN